MFSFSGLFSIGSILAALNAIWAILAPFIDALFTGGAQ